MNRLYHLIARSRDRERRGERRTFWLDLGQPFVVDGHVVVTLFCDCNRETGYDFKVVLGRPNFPGHERHLQLGTCEPIELPTRAEAALHVVAVEYAPESYRPIRVLLDLVHAATDARAVGQ